MKKKVSVIIPVYNAQKYLSAGINSVRRQTYQDIEIILVNDASTDKSLEICQSQAKEDPRIIIIDKELNEKALRARISGLKVATGDFIIFCDADDYMPCNAVEKLLAGQQRIDADITLGALVNYYDRFRLIKTNPRNLVDGQNISADYGEIEIQEKFSYAFFGVHSIPVTSPAKLFKIKLFTEFLELDHPPIHAFDDTYVNLLIFEKTKSISFVSDVVYYYRYGGYTSKLDMELLRQLSYVHDLRKKILVKKPLDKAYDYSLIEIKNTAYAFFLNAKLLSNLTYCDFVESVQRFKKMEMYCELKQHFKTKEFINDPFFNAIFANDDRAAYNVLNIAYKLVRKKRTVKRFIGRLLRAL